MVSEAVQKHPATEDQSISTVLFSKVWVGMAGYDRPLLKPLINEAFSELFRVSPGGSLRISSDIDLLPASLASNQDIASVIVLVVGTGSIAMNYKRDGQDFRRTGRIGGWGRILGDDGSGYDIGRNGVRAALRQCDMYNLDKGVDAEPAPFEPLAQAVLEHFQNLTPSCSPENLLDILLFPPSTRESGETDDTARTKAVASAASVVLSLVSEDVEAKKIVQSGASSVAALVNSLVKSQKVDLGRCALVLGGGLMGSLVYRKMVLDSVKGNCGEFSQVTAVEQPVVSGAKFLLSGNHHGRQI